MNTAVGTIDPTNTDWFWTTGSALPINFDGIVGPGGVAETSWIFNTLSNGANDFLAPLGIPLMGAVSSNYDSQAVGTGSGQFNPAHFHGNSFNLNTDNNSSSARGTISGGYWGGGAASGRFALILTFIPSRTNNYIGFRASISAGN